MLLGGFHVSWDLCGLKSADLGFVQIIVPGEITNRFASTHPREDVVDVYPSFGQCRLPVVHSRVDDYIEVTVHGSVVLSG